VAKPSIRQRLQAVSGRDNRWSGSRYKPVCTAWT
jgi:hypothetical protein